MSDYAHRAIRRQGIRTQAWLDDCHSEEKTRSAFHGIALELMAWQDPPLVSPREYRRLEQLRDIYRPYDPQGEVEPYDVQADWEENL